MELTPSPVSGITRRSATSERATAEHREAAASGVIMRYARQERIFDQGDPADTVLLIVEGRVRLSMGASDGREAIVGTLGAGAFLGEEALAGRAVMLETATAMTDCRVLAFAKLDMIRRLRADGEIARQFSAHLLSRRLCLEADLADQLINPGELRLARRLWLLARESSQDGTEPRVPAEVSQSLLADMVGTTRSRVNMFLRRFKKQGFIEYRLRSRHPRRQVAAEDARELVMVRLGDGLPGGTSGLGHAFTPRHFR